MPTTIMPKGEPVFTVFNQIGICHRDPEQFAKLFVDAYGMGPWFRMRFGDDHKGSFHIPVTDCYIDGVRTEDYCVETYAYALPHFEFEIIRPVCGRSVHDDFLKARNDVPGSHHLDNNMKVTDVDRFHALCDEAGLTRKVSAFMGGVDKCQFDDQQDLMGVYIEFHTFDGPKAGEEAGIGNYPADKKMPEGSVPSFSDGMGLTIVVRDVDRVVDTYASYFGVGPWEVSEDTDAAFNSEPMKRAVCIMDEGWKLELIQPLSDSGIYADYLKKWGPAVYAIQMVPCVAKETIIGQCKAAGGQAFENTVDGQTRTYLDHYATLGIYIEVV